MCACMRDARASVRLTDQPKVHAKAGRTGKSRAKRSKEQRRVPAQALKGGDETPSKLMALGGKANRQASGWSNGSPISEGCGVEAW